MNLSYRVGTESSPLVITLSLVFGLIQVVSLWQIFKKADEPGWAAIIPLYNLYILYKITWGSGWRVLLLLIPLVNIVAAIITVFKLSRAFGKGTGFGFGLLFLPFIFILILAFGPAQYQGPVWPGTRPTSA